MNLTEIMSTGVGVMSLFGWATSKLYGNLTNSVYDEHAKLYEPAGVVSIIIPAFNEEDYIEDTLKSILSQNILYKYRDYFECIVVDNESTDNTAKIAKQYCQLISAPRGKLNARHAGILEASGDIIVSCDADSYYPPNWLNLLIYHFYYPEVVAVCGPHLQQGNMLLRIGSVWYNNLLPQARNRINGANSAFLREAYFNVNGFDLSIDQFNREEMVVEEEILFLRKLRSIGKVVFNIQACCFAPVRGHSRELLIEQRRTKTKYEREVVRGERF